jgi:hypothetical protein
MKRLKSADLERHGGLSTAPFKTRDAADRNAQIVSRGFSKGEITAVIEFSVVVDGKLYSCDRRVSGIRRKRQTIYVDAVGSMDDPSSYLAAQRSIPVMEEAARMIALEIIYGSTDAGGDSN